MKFKLLLSLLLFSIVATPVAGETVAQKLARLGAFQQSEFLAVDDAFGLTVGDASATHFNATFTIADGYYLYRDKIIFRAGEPAPAKAGGDDGREIPVALPAGVRKDDPYFGAVNILKRDFTAPVDFRQTVTDTVLNVRATYQGCAEDGICYAPVTKTFAISLPSVISAARADGAENNNTNLLHATTLPALLFGALIAGLLLTFTPCVLPLLPILSAIISGHAGGDGADNRRAMTARKGATLAAFYVLGTMATYAAIGGIAGAAGEQLQAYFQNIWAIGFFAGVLVVMALAMFGVITVQLPAALQSRLRETENRWRVSTPLWIFLLGAMSALIVGACVSPVLISFLAIAISIGDATLGAAMMTAMAFGMGIPLLALGFGAGRFLPQAGAWMKNVNRVFGILLIAVAIYLLGALPAVPVLLLWGAFLMTLAIFCARAGGVNNVTKTFMRGIAVVFFVWSIAALVGGFLGGRDVLQPLAKWRAPPTVAQHPAYFIRVANLTELHSAFARARGENKLVMVDYYADWCVDCVRMDETTFRDATVRAMLEENFIALQVNVTDPRDRDAQALKKYFGVFGPPAVLFFDRDGAALTDKHFYGYRDANNLSALLAELSQ